MRILFVLHGFPPEFLGGTEFYGLRVAQALSQRGHQVEVLCGTSGAWEPPALERDEVEGLVVHRLHRRGLFVDDWDQSLGPDAERLFLDLLQKTRPDIVHVHHWLRLSRRLVAVSRAAGVVAVVTLHDLWAAGPAPRERDGRPVPRSLVGRMGPGRAGRVRLSGRELAAELAARRSDLRDELELAAKLIVPTRIHGMMLAKLLDFAPEAFHVLPHGSLLPPSLESLAPPALKRGSKLLKLGHWGHLAPAKGCHLLLEAVRRLPKRLRDRVRLQILGEALDESYAHRLAGLSVGLKVRWQGPFLSPDLAALKLDFAVFPSLVSESWSFVLDEAFALGLPVIVPDRGALGERAGACGLRFEPGSAASLGRVLEKIFQEPGLRERCAGPFPAPLPLSNHVDALEQLYRQALETRPPQRRWDPGLGSLEACLQDFRLQERYRRLLTLEGRQKQGRERCRDLEKRLHEAWASVREAQRSSATFALSVKRHQKRVEELERDLQELQESLSEHRREGARLAQEREALEGGLEHERSRKEELEQELKTVWVERDEARQAMEDLQQSLRRLETSCRQIEKGRDLALGKQDDLERQRTRLAQEGEALRRRVEALTRHVHNLEASIQEYRALQERLQSEITAQKKAREREQDERQDLEHAWERGLAAEQAASLRLHERVAELLADQVRLQEGLASLSAKRDGLNQELAVLGDERAEALVRARSLARGQSLLRNRWYFRWAERLARRSTQGAPAGALKILMVVHQFLPRHAAGSEIYTYNLARELARSQHVHLLFTEARFGVPQYRVRRGRYQGIPVTEVCHQQDPRSFERTWHDPRMRAIFEKELEREQPDIVHFQHLQNWSLDCVQAARAFGVPVVYTLHEYLLLCLRGGQMRRQDGELCERPSVERCADCIMAKSLGDPASDDARVRRAGSLRRFVPHPLRLQWRRWFPHALPEQGPQESNRADREAAVSRRLDAVARLAREVDLFISPSRFLAERFIASGLVRPEQIVHSDNGLDTSLFARRKPRPGATGLRLGYIGTISEYKGLHVLVEAMAGLKERPEIVCHVHGDLEVFGDYARSQRERGQALGIRFHGRYDNRRVGEILSDFDALVVPSLWYENAPLTIQEAFLAGLPVLASRLGGMAEFVREGENGLLFKPGDPSDLRRAILRLADEPGLLPRLRGAQTPVKSIQEDARVMERRYRHLIAGCLLESGRP